MSYKVMFYFGVYVANPFLRPNEVVEVTVDKSLGENEIIACAIMKLNVDLPRTYATSVMEI